jgi:hypothetical protein
MIDKLFTNFEYEHLRKPKYLKYISLEEIHRSDLVCTTYQVIINLSLVFISTQFKPKVLILDQD